MNQLRFTISALAICAVFGTVLPANADSGYQPYYYVQGAGQYVAPVAAPQPVAVQVTAPQVSTPQVSAPVVTQPAVQVAAPVTNTNIQVATPQPVMVPVTTPTVSVPSSTIITTEPVAMEPVTLNRPVQSASNDPLSSINHLPSYVYDPAVDVRRPAYVTPRARDPKVASYAMPLTTMSGFQIGLQFSRYEYQETVPGNDNFMNLKGPNFGLVMNGTKAYASGLFWGAEVRGVYGMMDYSGGNVDLSTGDVTPTTKSNEDNWILEPRLFVGQDYVFNDAFWGHANFALSPYIGFGYRYLNNDGRGTDSSGVDAGYRRHSNYLYFPFGVTNRFMVTDKMRASLNLEYDQLIYGWQKSELGDAISGAGDLENGQKKGHGFRGSLMAEWPKWSFGPFFNYWDIKKSEVACDSSSSLCGYEPQNETWEYGIESRYRF